MATVKCYCLAKSPKGISHIIWRSVVNFVENLFRAHIHTWRQKASTISSFQYHISNALKDSQLFEVRDEKQVKWIELKNKTDLFICVFVFTFTLSRSLSLSVSASLLALFLNKLYNFAWIFFITFAKCAIKSLVCLCIYTGEWMSAF